MSVTEHLTCLQFAHETVGQYQVCNGTTRPYLAEAVSLLSGESDQTHCDRQFNIIPGQTQSHLITQL